MDDKPDIFAVVEDILRKEPRNDDEMCFLFVLPEQDLIQRLDLGVYLIQKNVDDFSERLEFADTPLDESLMLLLSEIKTHHLAIMQGQQDGDFLHKFAILLLCYHSIKSEMQGNPDEKRKGRFVFFASLDDKTFSVIVTETFKNAKKLWERTLFDLTSAKNQTVDIPRTLQ